MRRSEDESIEKTPTKTPAGGNSSKLVGGKGGIEGAVSTVEILRNVGWALGGGGSVDASGIVQYARHGRGSLSGFNKWINKKVIDSARTVKKRRESSY
jgi:hypothetical protein